MKTKKVIEGVVAGIGGLLAAGLLFAFYFAVSALPHGGARQAPVQEPAEAVALEGTNPSPLVAKAPSPYRLLEVNISFAGDTGPALTSRWTQAECVPGVTERREHRQVVSEQPLTQGPFYLCLDPEKQDVSHGALTWRPTQKGGYPARGALLVASPRTNVTKALHSFVGVASLCSDKNSTCALTVSEGETKHPGRLSIALQVQSDLMTFQRDSRRLADEPEAAPDEEQEALEDEFTVDSPAEGTEGSDDPSV